jgi:hypothetical protein
MPLAGVSIPHRVLKRHESAKKKKKQGRDTKKEKKK